MTELRFSVSLLLLIIYPLTQAETLSRRVVRITDGDTPTEKRKKPGRYVSLICH